VDAAAHHLRHVYDNPRVAAELGRRGRERVTRTHSVERSAQALLAHYERIVGSLVHGVSHMGESYGNGRSGAWYESIRLARA
jgi:hypothetical protein